MQNLYLIENGMVHSFPKNIKRCSSGRASLGSHIAEFGASLVLFSLCVILPALDFAIVPIRAIMAQEILGKEVRRLACAESFGEAVSMAQNDPKFLSAIVNLGGVKIKSNHLYMQISNAADKKELLKVSVAGTVPGKFLPSAADSATTYDLVLELNLQLSPAFLIPGLDADVPGISCPFPLKLRASHSWENLGRNPETGLFYLNE